jgi:hypothetical protein
MYGIGDAIGDSATDVAWETVIWGEGLFACAAVVIGTCTDSGTYSQTIDAIDGSTAATAWTLQPEVSDIWLYPLGADVSGDGKDDLFSLDWASYTQGVRSGADGTPLWSKDLSDWVVLPPLGSVGGEVGSDFLEIGYEYLGSGLSLSLNRLDGATGATLFSSTYEPELPEESDSYAYAFLGGDLDGDGVLDPVIDMYVYDYVTGGETRSIGHAESGRDATILFARDVTGYVSTWPADGYDGGDLDGDGTDDLLELSLNDSTLTVGAHLMPDAGPAWTWTESYDDNQWLNWLYLFGTADTSGDGGDDLLLYREVYKETTDDFTFAGRFDVVEGSTGGVRWGKGRAFS